jgi:hypothetical protein
MVFSRSSAMPIAFFSPSAYPAQPLMEASPAEASAADTAAAPPPLRSTGMGKDMVRGLALMLIAAVMAVLVLLTEHLLLDRIDVGNLLGGLVLWSVLLSALLLLSRVSVRLSQAMLSRLDRWAQARAQDRSSDRHRASAH